MAEAADRPQVPAGAAPPDAAGTPAGGASPGTFSSLRFPNLRLLLIGTGMADAGQWLQQVTVSWLAYDLTGSGTVLGLVNLSRAATSVSVAPVAGVAIDRIAPRTLLVAINLWLMVVAALVGTGLLFERGELFYLFAFAFLTGGAQAINQPLRQAAVFMLVPREVAANAVALMQTLWGLMRSVGPIVGAAFIVWFGPSGNFFLQAGLCFLVLLNALRIVFPARAVTAEAEPFLRNLAGGVRYVAGDLESRTFLLSGWVMPFFIIPMFIALPPIYAADIFEGGPGTLGALLAAVGVGGVAGGFVTASLGRVDRRGLVHIGSLLLLSLSLLAFGFTSDLRLALPLFVAAGFFEMIFLTTNLTLLQMALPDEVRGRVTSLSTLTMGFTPLGALYAGIGADVIGPRATTLVLSTSAAAIAVALFLFSSTVRNYRLSAAIRAR